MEKDVVYVRDYKKGIREQDETGLRFFHRTKKVAIRFASIYSTLEPNEFEANFIPVKLPKPIDFENDFCYYTIGDKIFIHDTVSIFSKYKETKNPIGYYIGLEKNVLHKNFFYFKDQIENDKDEFIKHLRDLHKTYNNDIYNQIIEGKATVNEEDRERIIDIVKLIMELLYDLKIKYSFLAYKDWFENELENLTNNEERLLFLNKHLEEKNKIEESYFYTTVDQFVESRSFSWGDFVNGGSFTEIDEGNREFNKTKKKYIERRINEIKFKANSNTTLNKPTTIDQQLLPFSLLRKGRIHKRFTIWSRRR